MNVLVPDVNLRVETVNAVEEEWAEPKLVDTSGPDAYWQALADMWQAAETCIVLEGDKVPAPGVLRSLWECDRPWCLVDAPMRDDAATAPYPSAVVRQIRQRADELIPGTVRRCRPA